MTYAVGSLILASDYNGLIGTDPTNASNTLNAVWAIGNGYLGYGQTAIPTVSTAGTITASQWSTFITRLNSARTHQTGSDSGISSSIASGDKIVFLTTLQTQVTNAYTSALTSAYTGTLTTGSASNANWTVSVSNPGSNPPVSMTSQTSVLRAFGMRITFNGGGDATRYFFNAGGRISYNVSASQNASTTARTNEVISLVGFLGGIGNLQSNSSLGRKGSGGTLNTNLTSTGYYQLTTSNVVHVAVTSTVTNYTSDVGNITVKTNGTQGSYNDNGTVLDFWTNLKSNSGTDGSGGPYPTNYGFDDSIGVTVTQSIDVIEPEITNLTKTWGTFSITSL